MAYNSIFGMVGGATTFFLAWRYFNGLEGQTLYRPGYMVMAAWVGALAALQPAWGAVRMSITDALRYAD